MNQHRMAKSRRISVPSLGQLALGAFFVGGYGFAVSLLIWTVKGQL
ncbi:hypothetical protein [Streptomyces sp. NPDC059063]